MSDYKIFFDLLSPQYVKVFEYTGPNPAKILKVAKEIMLNVIKVDGAGFYEDSYKWDVMGDPVKFFAVWRTVEGLDARTKSVLLLKVQGEESIKEKHGSVTIWIRYYMTVTMPYGNPLQKTFAMMNAEMFYKPRVRQYQEEARRHVEEVEDLLRSTFDLIRKTNL